MQITISLPERILPRVLQIPTTEMRKAASVSEIPCFSACIGRYLVNQSIIHPQFYLLSNLHSIYNPRIYKIFLPTYLSNIAFGIHTFKQYFVTEKNKT